MPASNNKVTVVDLDDEVFPEAKHSDRSDSGGASTASAPPHARTRKPAGRRSILIVSAVALAIGGAYAAKHLRESHAPAASAALSHDKASSEKPLPGSPLAGPLEPPLPMPPAVQPKTAVDGSGAASLTQVTPAPPPATKSTSVTTADLTEIRDSVAQLGTDIKAIAGRTEQMEGEVASIKTNLVEQQAKATVAEEASRAVRRRSLAKAKPTVADKPATVTIGVLSVDTWDGHPSVSVSQGQEIRFIGEGDALPGGYVLKQADGRKQQATFVAPSGETLATQSTAKEVH